MEDKLNILLIGGTGAIGKAMIDNYVNHNYTVTSRKYRSTSSINVNFIKLDASNLNELENELNKSYDVIIDFLVYNSKTFQSRLETLLKSTSHYIFLSSSRVYSDEDFYITIKTKRLLDTKVVEDFISINDYALEKARHENILISSRYNNFSIVRPYITYYKNRLQFGPLELNSWLLGIIKYKTLIVYDGLLSKFTTLTSADDVAMIIEHAIIRGPSGGLINAASDKSVTWQSILELYTKSIKEILNIEFRIVTISKERFVALFGHHDAIFFDREFNRRFKTEEEYNGKYKDISHSLKSYFELFLSNSINLKQIDCIYEKGLLKCLGKSKFEVRFKFYICKFYKRLVESLKG